MVVDRLPRLTLASILVTPMCPPSGIGITSITDARHGGPGASALGNEGPCPADGIVL